MKVIYSVVLIFAVFTATYSYPAESSTPINKDVVAVPLDDGKTDDFGGVVDVEAGDGFFGNPFGRNPFPSIFTGLDELVNRMRQQLSQILSSINEKPGEFHIPQLDGVDLSKGNTTSETKIIDGHKVTINETEYRKAGENGTATAVFKVRVVDIHPDSSEVSNESNSEEVPVPVPNNDISKDRESSEDALTNEIPSVKSNEALNVDNIETFDEEDLVPPYKRVVYRNVDWNNARSVETVEDNSIDSVPPQQPIYDLSNDIYVNELLENSGAPHNPDAETFDPNVGPRNNFNRQPNYPEPMMNYPSRFERLPYYAPPTFPFNNFQQFPAPPPFPQFNYPPSFPYPNFPFDSRSQNVEQNEISERLRTNNVVPNRNFVYNDYKSIQQHPTEFIEQDSSVASGSSVPFQKSQNVPVTSS